MSSLKSELVKYYESAIVTSRCKARRETAYARGRSAACKSGARNALHTGRPPRGCRRRRFIRQEHYIKGVQLKPLTGSARLAQAAVGGADLPAHLVQAHSQNAARIGDVVGMISGIADQANLLALNAKIRRKHSNSELFERKRRDRIELHGQLAAWPALCFGRAS